MLNYLYSHRIIQFHNLQHIIKYREKIFESEIDNNRRNYSLRGIGNLIFFTTIGM